MFSKTNKAVESVFVNMGDIRFRELRMRLANLTVYPIGWGMVLPFGIQSLCKKIQTRLVWNRQKEVKPIMHGNYRLHLEDTCRVQIRYSPSCSLSRMWEPMASFSGVHSMLIGQYLYWLTIHALHNTILISLIPRVCDPTVKGESTSILKYRFTQAFIWVSNSKKKKKVWLSCCY